MHIGSSFPCVLGAARRQTRLVVLLLSIALLVAGRARAEDKEAGLHPALSLGSGFGHNLGGLGLELRSGHFGAAIIAGWPLVLDFGTSPVGSLRYYTDKAKWHFDLNGGLLTSRGIFDAHFNIWAFSLTAVRRWT